MYSNSWTCETVHVLSFSYPSENDRGRPGLWRDAPSVFRSRFPKLDLTFKKRYHRLNKNAIGKSEAPPPQSVSFLWDRASRCRNVIICKNRGTRFFDFTKTVKDWITSPQNWRFRFSQRTRAAIRKIPKSRFLWRTVLYGYSIFETASLWPSSKVIKGPQILARRATNYLIARFLQVRRYPVKLLFSEIVPSLAEGVFLFVCHTETFVIKTSEEITWIVMKIYFRFHFFYLFIFSVGLCFERNWIPLRFSVEIID